MLIVIDQYATWTFERDRPHFTGGLARMLREGAHVPDGELAWANTFTAPGHAAIGTGALPAVNGIVGNGWFRRADRLVRDAEHDPDAPVFPIGASHHGELEPEDTGSGRALRVDGIADALRAAQPRARSVAIALKSRAASFMIGRKPDAAIWYEPRAGGMTTSRAYAPSAPPWLLELARTKPVTRWFRERWTARDPDLLARVTGFADDAAGEGTVHGFDPTFPHDLAATDVPALAFPHTPYADSIVLDAAYAALDEFALGRDDIPDLLALGFNAHDYAGHFWGPDSWEAFDLALRLDTALGELFDELDRRYGSDGWAAVLTSDHGATPVVDRSRAGRRITSMEIRGAVDKALGGESTVAALASNNIYLKAERSDAELAAVVEALRKLPNIAAAGRTDRCEPKTELDRALCNAIVPGESGELYIVPAAGSLITDYITGTHHDAPFEDNRRVPIIVRAPGLRPQTGTGTLLQVAPTLAALLGVPPPAAASEPPLFGLR